MRYICTSIVATCMLAGTSFAATINVPADYTTIQAAVDAASDGDEILVAPGTYTGTGNEVVDTLGKAITIRATGTSEETIIDGEGHHTVVRCGSGEGAGTIIEGFTITGGFGYSSGYGGGIFCVDSSPTIKNCTITNNTAPNANGGGISCYDNSNPTITGCTISDNTAPWGGGIYCQQGSSPAITDCTISSNTADDGGGIGLFYSCNPTITDCEISDNTATDKGGGINCGDNSSPTITGCTITNNTSAADGGGIWCPGSSIPTLFNSTVCGNSPNQIAGSYSDEAGNTVTAVCPIPGACCTNGECVIAEQADCLAFHGTWLGEGTTCDDSPCPTSCLGDINGDGQVSTNDLLTVIANWGVCP